LAHLHRFYIPPDWPTGDEISLPEEEARHGAKVLRLKTGDRVALFNGLGKEWTGQVTEVTKRSLLVGVEEVKEVARPERSITLILGQLLRDKTVEAAIEATLPLGVQNYILFRADHSDRGPKGPERFVRTAIETAKQCGSLWLPNFQVCNGLEEALAVGAWDTLLVARLDATPLPLAQLVEGQRIGVIIGPEGDLSARELALAEAHGAKPLSLGPLTLRTELAATVAAALLQQHLLTTNPIQA